MSKPKQERKCDLAGLYEKCEPTNNGDIVYCWYCENCNKDFDSREEYLEHLSNQKAEFVARIKGKTYWKVESEPSLKELTLDNWSFYMDKEFKDTGIDPLLASHFNILIFKLLSFKDQELKRQKRRFKGELINLRYRIYHDKADVNEEIINLISKYSEKEEV